MTAPFPAEDLEYRKPLQLRTELRSYGPLQLLDLSRLWAILGQWLKEFAESLR